MGEREKENPERREFDIHGIGSPGHDMDDMDASTAPDPCVVHVWC